MKKDSNNNSKKIENIFDNTSSHEVTASSNSDVNLSLIDICQESGISTSHIFAEPKSLKEKEINDFLYEKNKENNVSSVVFELEQDNEIDEVDTSQIVEQELMQELSQNTPDIEINESYIQNLNNSTSGLARSLSYLFDKAVVKSQEEILCWYYYSLEFKNRVKSKAGVLNYFYKSLILRIF
ncbi:hypothetical protein Glove_120g43 [Diversispora epigaea]|uniref:Uncharacterized protein n=1 Tax=Diversispora epigaea TaxID=1348612 RepID=A0A397J8V7_9GLOM|nr:hypothetical protein Glove_120g43 [Diversispora epigaea]